MARKNSGWLSKLLALAGVGVLGLFIVIATRPDRFHVERSVQIAAPPENAFVHVNDFHGWSAWSPYEKLDPDMERSYEGAPSGVGAIYAWKSDTNEVGEGRMTILKSERPRSIVIELQFITPFPATNVVTFRFEPTAGGTRVTWAMDGTNTFMGKAVSLFMDFDQLVGSDFERGLASLKALAESASAAPARAATTEPTPAVPEP